MLLITRRLGLILVLLGLAICGPSSGRAAVMTLENGNSIFSVDATSQAGANSWTVDGARNLYQQWFWYRIGSTGPEASIDTISAPVISYGDLDGDLLNEIGKTTYENGTIKVEVIYSLSGGAPGSGVADVGEQIKVSNKTSTALDFHFFQYSDFDLTGSAGGDTLKFVNANTVRQYGDGATLSETVVTPAASHFEGDYWASTINKLNDNVATTLNDLNSTSSPGDVTWAFEWDTQITRSGSFSISKDKQIVPVPEPCTLIVWSGLGGLGLLLARRRRQRLAA